MEINHALSLGLSPAGNTSLNSSLNTTLSQSDTQNMSQSMNQSFNSSLNMDIKSEMNPNTSQDGTEDRKKRITSTRTSSYKKRSTVWLHFTLDRERGAAICNYCGRPINYSLKSGTTSNLLKHANDQHSEYLDEETKARFQMKMSNKLNGTKMSKFETAMVYEGNTLSNSAAQMYEEVEEPLEEPLQEMTTGEIDRDYNDRPGVTSRNTELGTEVYVDEGEYIEEEPTQPTQFFPRHFMSSHFMSPQVNPPRVVPPRVIERKKPTVASSHNKPTGFMDAINQRLDRIERKVDLLMNYLIGENNYETEEGIEDVQPMKRYQPYVTVEMQDAKRQRVIDQKIVKTEPIMNDDYSQD